MIRLKHGHNKKGKISKIYTVWANIVQRCTNLNSPNYKNYGGRGITICKRWLKFENFLFDIGEPPTSKHQIDRIDNDKGYKLSNCEWVLSKTNSRNRRNNHLTTFNNKTQCLSAWAEEYNIKQNTLWCRLYKWNWSIKKALTTPTRKYKINKGSK